MDIAHVHVVSEKERKQGEAALGWQLGLFFALIVGYFAVVYWPVTLAALGVVLVIALVTS